MKEKAKKVAKKQIVIIAAEHLVGNAHILSNQLNETADNMAIWLALPEVNHHFMEAFSYPKNISNKTLYSTIYTIRKLQVNLDVR